MRESGTIAEANDRLHVYARQRNQQLREREFAKMTKAKQRAWQNAGWTIADGWRTTLARESLKYI